MLRDLHWKRHRDSIGTRIGLGTEKGTGISIQIDVGLGMGTTHHPNTILGTRPEPDMDPHPNMSETKGANAQTSSYPSRPRP